VHENVYADFCEKFAQRANKIVVGDPFEPSTSMGPLKNERRLSAIEALVKNARDSGAQILAGGNRKAGEGLFYEPTVIAVMDLSADVCSVEPFGPVALILPVKDAAEAVNEANRLPFGLASYVFTNNMQLAYRFSNEIEAGVVCVNDFQASLPETPFGGYKDSGLGSEGGIEGAREFVRTKCVRHGGLA
jgi:succinate-semialdehyde dehydrogenase/glutarate-semialdehyde dehydrogenase